MGQPILRPAPAEALMAGNGRGMACFPLVPYSNRVAGGRFSFAGTAYQLARNFGDHPNSIHGVGWQRAWQVTQVAPDAATLSLEHTQDADWPFAFSAAQRFQLSATALRIDLSITNRHATSAPAGLGLHPYFPRGGAMLGFRTESVWHNGSDMVPTQRTAVPPDWDHATARAVGSVALDNCFEGWDGVATLAWPDRTLTIEASEIFRHLIVYTPAGQDFFCVEPVSHANDAINRDGMHVLAPDETLRGAITFHLG